jgi:nitroreductase
MQGVYAVNMLDCIKNRCTIRKYKNRKISDKLLAKVLEAGVWGPSVPSFLKIQPWEYVVIVNKNRIERLAKIIAKASTKLPVGPNILVGAAARIIVNAPVVVLIYNSNELHQLASHYRQIYSYFEDILGYAENCAIAASIQNMIIAAEYYGLGTCWLDTPLLCKDAINHLARNNSKLAAILTIGYPDERGHRSPRKSSRKMVRFIR